MRRELASDPSDKWCGRDKDMPNGGSFNWGRYFGGAKIDFTVVPPRWYGKPQKGEGLYYLFLSGGHIQSTFAWYIQALEACRLEHAEPCQTYEL